MPSSLEGVASGTNSAFREVGGVLGIAVLGAVFSSSGGYASAQDYVNGLRPAILVGAVAVLLGTFTALFVPRAATYPHRGDVARRTTHANTGPARRRLDAAGSDHLATGIGGVTVAVGKMNRRAGMRRPR